MANLSTFVVKSAFSLAVRIVESGESEKPSYLINEGIHGAFWRLLETDEILKPKLITGKEAVDCEINFAFLDQPKIVLIRLKNLEPICE